MSVIFIIMLIPLFIVFLLNFVFLLIFMHREYKEYTGQMSVDELKSDYGDLNKGLKFTIDGIKTEVVDGPEGLVLFYFVLPAMVCIYYILRYKTNKEYFKRIEEMI